MPFSTPSPHVLPAVLPGSLVVKSGLLRVLVGLVALAISGCGPGISPRVPEDRSRPLTPAPDQGLIKRRFSSVDRNVLRAARRVVPLLEYLGRHSNAPLELAYFEDHETQLEALLAGRSEFAWLSPTAYVLARRRLPIVPLVRPIQDSRSTYRSILVTRDEGPIQSLEDLKGKRVAFVRPDSTSGNVFPRAFLRARGIDPETEFSASPFSGSHYKSFFMLSQGQVDAAFVEDGNLDKVMDELSFKLRVVTTVATIPHGPIVAHPDVPLAAQEALREAFKAYDTDPTNRALVIGMMRQIRIESFHPAADEDYADVRTHVLTDLALGGRDD